MITSRTLAVLTAAVSLAFAWVIWPFFAAVFWAVILVIVLDPLSRWLTVALGQRRTLSAVIMVLGFVLLVVLPALLVLAAVASDARVVIAEIRAGEVDFEAIFKAMIGRLPALIRDLLSQSGLADLGAIQASITASLGNWISASASTVLSAGRSLAGTVVEVGVMLYLMFFLFRDGQRILARVKSVTPMEPPVLDHLLATFTQVVRATVRGDIAVALLQGGLGGLAFWVIGIHGTVLWTALMALLSLLPVLGASLVWAPTAIYLMATGHFWTGFGLALYGVLVISLIDNIVRPWLVGQATRMPDYLVLVSTLGGIATFGIQGFVTGPVIAAMFIAVWTAFPRKTVEETGPGVP